MRISRPECKGRAYAGSVWNFQEEIEHVRMEKQIRPCGEVEVGRQRRRVVMPIRPRLKAKLLSNGSSGTPVLLWRNARAAKSCCHCAESQRAEVVGDTDRRRNGDLQGILTTGEQLGSYVGVSVYRRVVCAFPEAIVLGSCGEYTYSERKEGPPGLTKDDCWRRIL